MVSTSSSLFTVVILLLTSLITDNRQQELSGDNNEGDENPYAEQAHNDQYDDISNESRDDVNVNGIGTLIIYY
jgi:hypothetical protein